MGEPFDPNVTVAAVATDVEQLPPEYKKAFRRSVEEALQYVFHVSAAEAHERSNRYFDGDSAPTLFAYHRHVLHIASDLSDAADEPLSDTQQKRYLEFAAAEADAFGLPRRRPSDGDGLRSRPTW